MTDKILSCARFSPRPFCDGTPYQIFDPSSIHRFYHQFEETSNVIEVYIETLFSLTKWYEE